MKQEANSEAAMNIQWYPGHMTKTRRMIEADVKLVDAVCEILDARIPLASRNPDIDAICGTKPRMIILNRIDMADPVMTKRWAEHFRAKGYSVLQTDCKTKKGISGFVPAVRTLLAEKLKQVSIKPDSLRDWNDALQYLARQPPEATAETAKERLIQALSRPR